LRSTGGNDRTGLTRDEMGQVQPGEAGRGTNNDAERQDDLEHAIHPERGPDTAGIEGRLVTRTANPPEEYWFEKRCYITEWWNMPADTAVSVARARVEPGVTTRLHCLEGITERYLILEGTSCAEVAGAAPLELIVGEVVVVPPGASQRIRNVGTCDLVFLAVCTPRFTRDAYEDIDPDPM